MTDKVNKSGNKKGLYTPTPVTVTFPATFPNADLAGKTVTYAGRGRKPTWFELAVETGLIAEKTKSTETPAPATTEAEAKA